MNVQPHIWIAALFCCLLAKSATSADSRYEACAPRNCGTGPNISYPFYIEGIGADYCGLQGFKIGCDERKRPIFQTSRGPYVVSEINLQNKSIRLVDNDVVGASCLAPKHYFIFDWETFNFSFSPNHANLQFFYGCNESFNLGFEKSPVPCASNSTHFSFVALVREDMDLTTTSALSKQYCESEAAVPIDLEHSKTNQTIKTVNSTRLLTEGFTVFWSGNSNASYCDRCQQSGGRCGVQDRVSVCFCPEGPISTACGALSNVTDSIGNNDNRGKGRESIVKAAIASTVSVIGALIVLLCYLKFFWKKKSQTHQNVETFLKNYGPLQVRRYSYLDIKKMTNSFTEKLGQGGFGVVFKGKLENGQLVAVKVLNEARDDDAEEFMNEVTTISRTSHVNVVTMVGFCFDGPNRALIYEFMPKGSLEKFIFDENPTDQKSTAPLGWDTLYQISLGIARGLEYLHRGCNARILHFDIKPHNILLDENFTPKISDFGLAKICTRKESLISMMGPRGTAGYIAPEIFSRSFGGVSHKSDVYSYGMMVLDMIGGKNNMNIKSENTSDIYFPHWIYKRLELNEELGLERIMDEEDVAKVKKMIMVGLWCIQIVPSERPSMSEVIEMLEGFLSFTQIPPKPFLSSPDHPRL